MRNCLPAWRLATGLEKPRFFFNPAQWAFLGFLGFLGLSRFLGFLGVFWFFYIYAQKREFLGFFQFQEYF
jgi:hypothetical protein